MIPIPTAALVNSRALSVDIRWRREETAHSMEISLDDVNDKWRLISKANNHEVKD